MGSISMADIFRKQNIDNGYVSIWLGSGAYTRRFSTADMGVHIYDDDEGYLSADNLHISLFGIELIQGTHYTRGDTMMDWPYFTATVTGIGGGISGSATIKYIADNNV